MLETGWCVTRCQTLFSTSNLYLSTFQGAGKETVIKRQDLHCFRAGVALHPLQPCTRVLPPRRGQPQPFPNTTLAIVRMVTAELSSRKSVSAILGFSQQHLPGHFSWSLPSSTGLMKCFGIILGIAACGKEEEGFNCMGSSIFSSCFYGYPNGVYIYPSRLSHVCNFGGGGGG